MARNEELIADYNKILQETKTWNQNRLFLFWGASIGLFFSCGLELFKIFSKEYQNNLLNFIRGYITSDYYLIGISVFFIFSLVLAIISGRIIDERANNLQGVVNALSKEIAK